MPKIIVAMPAYNEGDYIASMVIRIRKYTDEDNIIVVDDGSTDDTVDNAIYAGASVVRNSGNMGYGYTIRRILKEASKREFDALVILDADTQHFVGDIPRMVDAVMQGSDLIIGCRNKKTIPIYRKIGQGAISLFVRALSGSKVQDTQSGFRAFSRKAVELLDLKQDGMAISSEMVSNATKKGLKIIEVPISVKYTKDSSTINPVVQGVDTLARVISMISERKPLMFFGVGGLMAVISGLFMGIRTYNMLKASGILPAGTAMEALLLLIVGILSIFTGIILNALARRLK